MSEASLSQKCTVKNGIELIAGLCKVVFVNDAFSSGLISRYEILSGEGVAELRHGAETAVELLGRQLDLVHL
jgi:hypothetical protein